MRQNIFVIRQLRRDGSEFTYPLNVLMTKVGLSRHKTESQQQAYGVKESFCAKDTKHDGGAGNFVTVQTSGLDDESKSGSASDHVAWMNRNR
jgi:hypothetical protein